MRRHTCYFIDRLPDMTMSKYGALRENDVNGLLGLEKLFLRQWAAICGMYGLTLHLIVTHSRTKPNGRRLGVCLVFGGDEKNLSAAGEFLSGSSLREYYSLSQNAEGEAALGGLKFSAACALAKRERKLISQRSDEAFYFVSSWEMNEDARLIDMIRMMESVPGDCAYRADIFPGPLAELTRAAFGKPISALRQRTGFSDEGRLVISGQRTSMPRDHNAEDALKQFEDWIGKIETAPHFRANIYAFARDARHAELLLHSAASEALEKGDYTVFDISAGSVGESVGTVCPDSFGLFHGFPYDDEARAASFRSKEFPESVRFWPTSFTYDEMAPFFRMPALYEGEVIQLPKETAANLETAGLPLGKDASGHDVFFPPAKLNKHAFICGVPGSGKTNTMLHLTSTLWKKYGIPFLVLEPAKKEYRATLNDPGMKDVMLFSPNAGTVLPIAVNPFEFPEGLTLSEHISALMQVFSGAFEVQGPVWYYLNRAIETAYRRLGWKDDTVNGGGLDYPILADIIEIYREGVESSSYDGELKGNLTSFLQVRLGGLMTRELDEMFNVSQSTLPPEDWLKTPAVIELEALEQGACNFFILLLCTLIRETLKASPNAGAERGLRHVIFIEEAHNLIAPETRQQSQDFIDPKVSATAYIVKMLAEVRALNEGIVIADQLPSAIASEVMKNTGLKIVHRMTAEDDRGMVGATMSATDAQLEQLGTYGPGEALIFYEGLQRPFRGKMAEWEGGKFNIIPAGNAELVALMTANDAYKAAVRDTVNGQILKLYGADVKKIDDCLETVLDEAGLLNDYLDEISGMDGEERDAALSDVAGRHGELCSMMEECRRDIFAMKDAIVGLKSRFPDFAANFAKVSVIPIQKIERYNKLVELLAELEQRL